jgi:hypothetical protein
VSQLSNRWRAGWLAGGGVVVVAAGLLLDITARARRIAREAEQITASLDRATENTAVLFELTTTNLRLDQAARRLRELRRAG